MKPKDLLTEYEALPQEEKDRLTQKWHDQYKIEPIPNARPEDVKILPIPNADPNDNKVVPLTETK